MKFSKFKKEIKKEYDEINNKEIEVFVKKKTINKSSLKFIIPLLAVFLLVFGLFMTLGIDDIYVTAYNKSVEANYNEMMESVLNNDTSLFKNTDNYNDISDLKKLYNKKETLRSKLNIDNYNVKGNFYEEAVDAVTITAVATSFNPTAVDDKNSLSSYDTNNQKEGIEEADIAKFDTKYVYYVSSTGILYIYDLEGNIIINEKISDLFKEDIDEKYLYCSYCFVNKEHMYNLKLQIYNEYIIIYNERSIIILKFEDNKLDIVYKNDFRTLIETRLVENNLYVVGTYVNDEKYASDDINYTEEVYNPNAILKIFKINLEDFDIKIVDNICNFTSFIYMDFNYIVIPSYLYFSINNETNYTKSYAINANFTFLYVYDLDLNPVRIFKTPGIINDQYAIDIKDDYLRCVSTSNNLNLVNCNKLSIFDIKEGKLINSLSEGLGKDYELVKSTTFDGDLCYVVTFRNTDPLYEIDLSDPYDIKIISALEVPGYSEYLYPFSLNDKNYVLGLGIGDDLISKKISLYEVNNGENMVVGDSLFIYSKRIAGYYTDFPVNSDMIFMDYPYYFFTKGVGLFFYNNDNELYFGFSGYDNYYLLKINPEEDKVINIINKIEIKDESRLFLYNGYVYIPDSDNLIIYEWEY